MPELSKRAMIVRCAYLYYREKLNIQEIGTCLGISRFRVSRYLKEAEDLGVVEIRINDPSLHYETLALELESKFSLNRVVAVPVTKDMSSEMVRKAVGHKGVEILRGMDKGVSVGITWGRTIAHMVEELSSGEMEISRISELAGGLGMINADQPTSALASLFAKKVGASCYQMSGPIIASDPTIARNMMNDVSICRTLETARQSDIAICGMSSLTEDSLLFHAKLMNKDDFRRILDAGAVGSILGRFFDSEGNEIVSPYKEQAISISWDDFLAIPERIVLAGGWGKEEGIRGLLAGGVATTIIIDSVTAASIMNQDNN
jgi:DNA-binding transcriptional regulator LsrR (DeoR family)